VSTAALLRNHLESALASKIPGAFNIQPQTTPEMIATGFAEVDRKCGGVPRGRLSEICGPVSSGRTTLLLSTMQQVTAHGECCALIDATNSFDPMSAEASGIDLRRLLWVRCARPHPKLTPVDKALKAADLIIHAGGFGLIVLDLADVNSRVAQKIPLSWWYRFRRAVEGTRAAFVVLEQQPSATSCTSLLVSLNDNPQSGFSSEWRSTFDQTQDPKLLYGFHISAKLSRSRMERKPTSSVASFRVPSQWAAV
jgi:hypothetical protein